MVQCGCVEVPHRDVIRPEIVQGEHAAGGERNEQRREKSRGTRNEDAEQRTHQEELSVRPTPAFDYSIGFQGQNSALSRTIE